MDHRSFKQQAIKQEPTIHLGSLASRQEKRGIKTTRGERNREIQKNNLKNEYLYLEVEKDQLKAKYAKAQNYLRQLIAKSQDLRQREQVTRHYREKIALLKVKHAQLSVWAGFKRSLMSQQLESLTLSQSQANQALARDHKLKSEQIKGALCELEQQINLRQQSQAPLIKALEEITKRQAQIEKLYPSKRQAADQPRGR